MPKSKDIQRVSTLDGRPLPPGVVCEINKQTGKRVLRVQRMILGQRINRTCSTIEEAEAVLAYAAVRKIRTQAGERVLDPVTLSVACDAYLADTKGKRTHYKAQEATREIIEWCKINKGGDCHLHSITTADLKLFRTWLLREGRKSHPYKMKVKVWGKWIEKETTAYALEPRSTATANRVMDSISAMMALAVQGNHIASNPCLPLPDLKPTREEQQAKQRTRKSYTPTEVCKIMQALLDAGDVDAFRRVALLIGLGPRSCELDFTVGDVVWDRRRVGIVPAKGGQPVLVPASDLVMAVLREQRAEMYGDSVVIDHSTGTDTRPLFSPRPDLLQAVKVARERLGIHGGKPLHLFRASWATWQARAGVSTWEIAHIGGWSGSEIVEQSYAHHGTPEPLCALVSDPREHDLKVASGACRNSEAKVLFAEIASPLLKVAQGQSSVAV